MSVQSFPIKSGRCTEGVSKNLFIKNALADIGQGLRVEAGRNPQMTSNPKGKGVNFVRGLQQGEGLEGPRRIHGSAEQV